MDDKYNIYMIGFYLTNIIVFTDLYLYMSLKMLFLKSKVNSGCFGYIRYLKSEYTRVSMVVYVCRHHDKISKINETMTLFVTKL